MSARKKRTALSIDVARALRGNTLMTGVAFAVLQAQPANAVSLGELRVQSALGQPLVATTTARIGPGESLASSCITAPESGNGLSNPDGLRVTAQSGNTRLAASRAAIPAGQDYRVRNGDTLSMIAQRIEGRPVGSTWRVAEML